MTSIPAYDRSRNGVPCPRCDGLLCTGPNFFADAPECQSPLFAITLAVACVNRYCPHCGWVVTSAVGKCNHDTDQCPARQIEQEFSVDT